MLFDRGIRREEKEKGRRERRRNDGAGDVQSKEKYFHDSAIRNHVAIVLSFLNVYCARPRDAESIVRAFPCPIPVSPFQSLFRTGNIRHLPSFAHFGSGGGGGSKLHLTYMDVRCPPSSPPALPCPRKLVNSFFFLPSASSLCLFFERPLWQ